MKKFLSIACLTLLYANLFSQVTIGSNESPNAGALLDLKMDNSKDVNSSKGLGLPRVELKNIRTEKDLGKTMGATESGSLEHNAHIGLVVYNTGMNIESEATRFCPGIHVWDGEKWQPFIPYPEIQTFKGDYISYKRSFEYLDPNNPAGWPADKEAARAKGYYQLGRNVLTDGTSPNGTNDIRDQRTGETAPNTYTVSRFYVGYKVMTEEYQIKKSLACSTEEPEWDKIAFLPEVYEDITKVFDEGVWMTQSLRTTRFPDGTQITPMGSGVDPTNWRVPQYYYPNNSSANSNYGVLYNFSAAIALGAKNTNPANPSTFPDVTSEQGGSTKRDVLYQGVCPSGWNLPNDQEWTDLANGIVANHTLFAQPLGGSISNVDYDFLWNPANTSTASITEGGYLGQAMKSQNKISTGHQATNGKSFLDGSGFNAYMTGSGVKTSGSGTSYVYDFGRTAYFWTSSLRGVSSSSSPSVAYYRFVSAGNVVINSTTTVTNTSMIYFRDRHYTDNGFSVRCKKIADH